MRVKITKSYTVILENWYLQLLIQYLLKEKVIDKCFCGFGWCPLSVTRRCDHIHPTSEQPAPPAKIHQRKWKKKKKPTTYRTSREESRDCQLLAWRFRLPFRSIFLCFCLARSESYRNSYVYGRYLNRSLSFKRDQSQTDEKILSTHVIGQPKNKKQTKTIWVDLIFSLSLRKVNSLFLKKKWTCNALLHVVVHSMNHFEK